MSQPPHARSARGGHRRPRLPQSQAPIGQQAAACPWVQSRPALNCSINRRGRATTAFNRAISFSRTDERRGGMGQHSILVKRARGPPERPPSNPMDRGAQGEPADRRIPAACPSGPCVLVPSAAATSAFSSPRGRAGDVNLRRNGTPDRLATYSTPINTGDAAARPGGARGACPEVRSDARQAGSGGTAAGGVAGELEQPRGSTARRAHAAGSPLAGTGTMKTLVAARGQGQCTIGRRAGAVEAAKTPPLGRRLDRVRAGACSDATAVASSSKLTVKPAPQQVEKRIEIARAADPCLKNG